MDTRGAYAECRRLAKHYENFPVASRLMPPDRRDALAAIYAFARTADDFADEPDIEDRLPKLADWRRKLDACFRSETDDPIFTALADTIRQFDLEREPFDRLLDAFEMDARGTTFRDFNALLSYCERSANPVGRLVLALFGHRDADLARMSDSICTALQLANFWQDVSVDLARHRLYIPAEDMDRFGYSKDDLEARRADERWNRLMAFEVRRTRELFDQGSPLLDRVDARLVRPLRMTWLGGTAILDKIETLDFDTLHHRPRISAVEAALIYLRSRWPVAASRPTQPAATSSGL